MLEEGKIPTVPTLEHIAQKLGVEVWQLLKPDGLREAYAAEYHDQQDLTKEETLAVEAKAQHDTPTNLGSQQQVTQAEETSVSPEALASIMSQMKTLAQKVEELTGKKPI